MRLIAPIQRHDQYKRAMIYQTKEGTYLFLYTSQNDCSCKHDNWFSDMADAIEYCAEKFNIQETQWSEISDPLPGCFHDFIYPVPMELDERQKALIQAADGDLEWTQSLLTAGADPNGMPFLMAIQCLEPQIVHTMIKAGADVNFDFANTTPLIRAINSASAEIVEILISSGADVNKKSVSGQLPLDSALQESTMKVSITKQDEIVGMLKTHGAQ